PLLFHSEIRPGLNPKSLAISTMGTLPRNTETIAQAAPKSTFPSIAMNIDGNQRSSANTALNIRKKPGSEIEY
ncbi:MAG: hypothetical protein WCY56_04030, partial [Aminobacteriaceae bacterium]